MIPYMYKSLRFKKCFRQILGYHPSSTHWDKQEHTLGDTIISSTSWNEEGLKNVSESTECEMTHCCSSKLTSWLYVRRRWSARRTRYSSPIRKEEDQSGSGDRLLIVQEGWTVPEPLCWCHSTPWLSENTGAGGLQSKPGRKSGL